jgi:hypothetical protein
MPGTRQQLVACALALAAAPRAAHAFHNGSTFDRAPGAGGGGGLFYTGAPRERGWSCLACHTDPRGRLEVDVSSQPPELIAEGRFRPGTAYAISIAMRDPQGQLGLASTRANYNGIGVSVVDGEGGPAGVIGGFEPGRYYARGTSILASDSTMNNETAWSFTWTAPAAPAGPIAIHLGVVDGNGAGVGGASTLTDPLGDDVVIHAFTARPEGAAAAAAGLDSVDRALATDGRGRAQWAPLLAALAIIVCVPRRRRSGSRVRAAIERAPPR